MEVSNTEDQEMSQPEWDGSSAIQVTVEELTMWTVMVMVASVGIIASVWWFLDMGERQQDQATRVSDLYLLGEFGGMIVLALLVGLGWRWLYRKYTPGFMKQSWIRSRLLIANPYHEHDANPEADHD